MDIDNQRDEIEPVQADMNREPAGITNRREKFPSGVRSAADAVRELDAEEPGHG